MPKHRSAPNSPQTPLRPETSAPPERSSKAATDPLTPDELSELADWQPDAFELPVHALIKFQMRNAMKGIESAVIYGPPGVGKSHAVVNIAREVEQEELERAGRPGAARAAQRTSYFVAAQASSPKGALIDVYQSLTGVELSTGTRRAWGPKTLQEKIVEELKHEESHLLIIDEAQFYEGPHIDLLRQVPDTASTAFGYKMGLMLVGTEGLREAVVASGQLGQRFGADIEYPKVTRSHLEPNLEGFHPHLPALRAQLGDERWGALAADLFATVNGKFRRLVTILANANALAVQNERRISERTLRTAIDKLAPEV